MFSNIHFILVEPKLPENVGACARVLKTMGFKQLVLVNPCDFLCDRALWVAHGSESILKTANVYTHISDAVSHLDWVVGTSAKPRHLKKEYIEARNLPNLLVSKGDQIKNAGIVFGCEDKGLSSKELALCDCVSGIPLDAPQPSLNLSHAVMVYAYELSKLTGCFSARHDVRTSPPKTLNNLKALLKSTLKRTDMTNDNIYYQQIMERVSLLGARDIGLMHFFLKHFSKHLPK